MKAEIVSQFHDWSRTQNPELYECRKCGRKATVDDKEFTEQCPKR